MSQIVVPPINLGKMTLTLKGTTPLIIHRFDQKILDGIAEKQGGAATKRHEPRNPISDCLGACYVIGEAPIVHCEDADNVWFEGLFGVPAISFKNAAVRAATTVAAKMTELRMAIQMGSSFDRGELLPIRCEPGPKMRRDVGRIKSAPNLVYRPEFWPWEVDVPIKYDMGMLGQSQVVSLFRRAGLQVGVGEWRPMGKMSTGVYGCWEVLSVKDEGVEQL